MSLKNMIWKSYFKNSISEKLILEHF